MNKNLALFLAIAYLFLMACKNDNKTPETVNYSNNTEMAYNAFGMKITDADALPAERMMMHYKDMKPGDTINSKMTAKIIEVCSKKGCWMTLDMGNDDEVMVRFKDYGFFMPLNAKGEVVVNGKAYVTETSVDELRHYAEDAGKSKEEIEAITEPKRTYAFEADGVLLKK